MRPSAPIGQDADRVEDRAGEEQQLRCELPDLPDVTETDVERAEQQAEPDGKEVELCEERDDEHPVDPRLEPLYRREDGERETFTQKVMPIATEAESGIRTGERQPPQRCARRRSREASPSPHR